MVYGSSNHNNTDNKRKQTPDFFNANTPDSPHTPDTPIQHNTDSLNTVALKTMPNTNTTAVITQVNNNSNNNNSNNNSNAPKKTTKTVLPIIQDIPIIPPIPQTSDLLETSITNMEESITYQGYNDNDKYDNNNSNTTHAITTAVIPTVAEMTYNSNNNNYNIKPNEIKIRHTKNDSQNENSITDTMTPMAVPPTMTTTITAIQMLKSTNSSIGNTSYSLPWHNNYYKYGINTTTMPMPMPMTMSQISENKKNRKFSINASVALSQSNSSVPPIGDLQAIISERARLKAELPHPWLAVNKTVAGMLCCVVRKSQIQGLTFVLYVCVCVLFLFQTHI